MARHGPGRRRASAAWLPVLVALAVLAAVAGAPAPVASATVGASSAPTPAAGAPTGFHSVSPFRLVDTRDALGIDHPLGPGETAPFALLGQGGIPAAGVGAVVLNVTLVTPSAATHLTLWPDGQPLPPTSSVNAAAGTVAANLQFVAPGPGGGALVFNNSGNAHVVIDVQGWLAPDAFGHFHPGDTPPDPYGSHPYSAAVSEGDAGVVDIMPIGAHRVPLARVSAWILDVNAADDSWSHLTIWTPGTSMPGSSNLNMVPGPPSLSHHDSNLVVVRPDAAGRVRVRNNTGTATVGLTVAGWFDDGASTGGEFVSITPVRIADSRIGLGLPVGGATADFPALGVGGIPASGVSGLVVTVTAVAAPGPAAFDVTVASSLGTLPPGFSAFPTTGTQQAMSVNPSDVRARLSLVAPGTSGQLRGGTSSWTCCVPDVPGGVLVRPDVIVDVVGYFTAGATSTDPLKLRPCDPLITDTTPCGMPFPSDFDTAPAATTTGRLVRYRHLPANKDGVEISLPELQGHEGPKWNNVGGVDGFSPGSQPLAYFPTADLTKSGAPSITDPQASLAPDSPVVLVDATTNTRVPVWVELDARATAAADKVLIITPARVLKEGHRHIVAIRRLVDAGNNPVPPPAMFRAIRDDLVTDTPMVESRRVAYEPIFADLAAAGIARADLQQAWDFTVRSAGNTAKNMLSIRDQSFAALGSHAPPFAVTQVDDHPTPKIARRVHGQYIVPNFLDQGTGPGSQFLYPNATREEFSPTAVPAANGFRLAYFQCNIPAAASPATRSRIAVYGHGLLGARSEIDAGNVQDMSQEHNFVFCATDWIGLAQEDLLTAASVLQDLSRFPTIPDRLQQGMLNTLFLGRLVRDDEGLATHPAFQASGQPVIDTSELFYDGNSQGGIMGAATTAVSQEWTRAVLGVTGMNYSMLLPRSVDFDLFLQIFRANYTNEREHALILQIVQLLWDRADPVGYVQHLTGDPYPGTPAHEVLLHVAFGDHQVANVSAEIESRAIGAAVQQPAMGPGRHTDLAPYWGIDPIPSFPYHGSALVMWDSGTPAPPLTATPPTAGEDPHEHPRRQVSARLQKSEFLRTGGAVVDVCGGAPCLASP